MLRPDGKNDFVQCPYNASHQILRHRFQTHLVRCHKNYPNLNLVYCPFNKTHLIAEVELESHVSTCPSRMSFEMAKTDDTPLSGLSLSPKKLYCGDKSQDREHTAVNGDWDEEQDVPSYNPTKHAMNSKVLRQPVGLSPSECRVFRDAERKRLQEQHLMK